MIFGEASISLGKGGNYTGPTAYCSIHPSPHVTFPLCHVATLPGDGAQHSKGMQPRGHRGASIALWIGQQAT